MLEEIWQEECERISSKVSKMLHEAAEKKGQSKVEWRKTDFELHTEMIRVIDNCKRKIKNYQNQIINNNYENPQKNKEYLKKAIVLLELEQASWERIYQYDSDIKLC